MLGPKQKIFLSFLVISFLFALSSFQAADPQPAWVKTVVAGDIFTGRVVGVSDGDTISVMRGGRSVKVRTSKEVVAMAEPLRQFTQKEYTRVLNECSARVQGWGQTECESILMEHGAPYGKAKNGAYIYFYIMETTRRLLRRAPKKSMTDF